MLLVITGVRSISIEFSWMSWKIGDVDLDFSVFFYSLVPCFIVVFVFSRFDFSIIGTNILVLSIFIEPRIRQWMRRCLTKRFRFGCVLYIFGFIYRPSHFWLLIEFSIPWFHKYFDRQYSFIFKIEPIAKFLSIFFKEKTRSEPRIY